MRSLHNIALSLNEHLFIPVYIRKDVKQQSAKGEIVASISQHASAADFSVSCPQRHGFMQIGLEERLTQESRAQRRSSEMKRQGWKVLLGTFFYQKRHLHFNEFYLNVKSHIGLNIHDFTEFCFVNQGGLPFTLKPTEALELGWLNFHRFHNLLKLTPCFFV